MRDAVCMVDGRPALMEVLILGCHIPGNAARAWGVGVTRDVLNAGVVFFHTVFRVYEDRTALRGLGQDYGPSVCVWLFPTDMFGGSGKVYDNSLNCNCL